MKTKLVSVPWYSNLVVQLSSGPTVLFLPFRNDTMMRAVTAGLMIQHHAIICVHLRSPCYPPLTPFDFFFSLSSPFFLPITFRFHSPSICPLSHLCLFLFSLFCCLFPLFLLSYVFFISSCSILLPAL